MLSFLITLIFAYNLYVGARRGIFLEGAYTIGFLLTLIFARIFYRTLGSKLTLLIPYPSASLDSHFAFFSTEVGLGLDTAFYRGCAFLMILVLGWLVTHFIMIFLNNLAYYPLDQHVSLAGGLFLAFVNTYVALFFLLYLTALIPVPGIQNMLSHSWIATLIVRYTPFLTHWATQLWILAA